MPSKKVVFAFGRFQPPTTGHELLVNAVKKIAHSQAADHIIFASRTQDKKANPLSVDRKVYYLKRMFPGTNFIAANEEIRTFMEAAKALSKKYKHLVMVAGSDRVQEYKKILEKYNGDVFTFDTIEVVSAGERDPDADSASGMSGTKMREAAKKGEFSTFKKGLPHTLTEIDGKRLMNEIRQGMGLDIIKEQIKFETNDLREKYHAGKIFNVGDKVTDGIAIFEIVDRGANYITVVNEAGSTSKKWLDSVKPTHVEEDVQPGYAPEEISFKGYTTKNLHHSADAAKAFQSTINKYNNGAITDTIAILNALKATDTYMKLNDLHLEQGKAPDEKELAVWHEAHDKARESLNRIGEFMHHFDYWHTHEHEIQDMENKFNPQTQGAEFADSYELEGHLIEMKFTSADKIKVARIIAATLGIEDVEKSSSPEQLVNSALRKIRSKPMRPEYVEVIHSMLKTAKEADIKYDEKLVPQKAAKVEESDQAWAAAKEKEKENALTNKDKSTLDKVRAMMAKEKKPMKEESELDEGTFKYHMDKAIAAHEKGDAKKKAYHLDNAKTAQYALKSTEYAKNKDLMDKYKSMREETELEEAHKIGDKVKIVSGSAKGIQGTIGEIRHGLFKGAPKTFTVYHSQNGATQVKKQHIRSVKEEVMSEEAPFKKLEHAVAYATDKVKTHRDNLDGIEVYKHKSGGYDVNHTMNSNGRNSLKSSGAKHLGTVYKDKPTNIKEENIEEERGSADKHWDIAQGHKEKASLASKGSEAYHSHMAAHHDSMANYHSQIGQSSHAEAHSKKADIHHEKAWQASNESVETNGVVIEAKKPTALDQYRKLAAERQKKHDDIEAERKAKSGDSKSAIDRLEKHLNKEEVDTVESLIEKIANAKLMGKPSTDAEQKLATLRGAADIDNGQSNTDNKDNDSDMDAEVKPVAPTASQVGHSMTSPEESPALRRMKIKYVHEAASTDAEKAAKASEKAAMQAKHAREKEQLASKQASEDERLKESTTEDDKEELNPSDIGSALTTTVGIKDPKDAKPKYVKEEEDKEDEESESEEAEELDDLSDADLDKMADEIDTEDDVMDAYDDEELAIIDDETGEHIDDLKEEVINEVLSRMERIKAKARFARSSAKRERRTRIALKSRSTSTIINSRARKLAVKLMKQRIVKKPLNKLSIGEKERVEKIVQRRKALINRLAMKLVPRVRKIENDRLSHKKYTK